MCKSASCCISLSSNFLQCSAGKPDFPNEVIAMSSIQRLKDTPVTIGKLSRLPFLSLGGLPDSGGVYFVLDQADRVWYVGSAVSLRDNGGNRTSIETFARVGAPASLLGLRTAMTFNVVTSSAVVLSTFNHLLMIE